MWGWNTTFILSSYFSCNSQFILGAETSQTWPDIFLLVVFFIFSPNYSSSHLGIIWVWKNDILVHSFTLKKWLNPSFLSSLCVHQTVILAVVLLCLILVNSELSHLHHPILMRILRMKKLTKLLQSSYCYPQCIFISLLWWKIPTFLQ